ncbi:hypothetical protein JG688_00010244 [Phytophthora aleatoria]|uniref:Uncharacterized protein n=1 Tax=Phytophthora aleatoria TaxID=2496075 RepID=A0A8J5MFN3_9STRA|nr:hypothetical protein JG688_00010244 [Phytophthora aleatoria]
MSTSVSSKPGASASGSSVLRLSQAPLAVMSSSQARLASSRWRRSSSMPTRMPASFVARHVGYQDPSHRPPPLVGVPATLADVSEGTTVRHGEDGLEMVVEGGCLSDRDLDYPTRLPVYSVKSCQLSSSTASKTSPGVCSTRPVTYTCCWRTFATWRPFADNSHVVRDAGLRELERLREYWVARLAHESEAQAQQREREREDSAYRHRADLEARNQRLQRLKVQVASGEERSSRTEAASEHGRLRGNWERLLALLEHYRDNSEPPNDWMSRVDVDDLKDADYMASPYPSLQERIAKGMESNPSPETQHGVTPVDTSTQVTRDPAHLDLSSGVDKVAKASPAKSAKAPARKQLKAPSTSPSRRPRASESDLLHQLLHRIDRHDTLEAPETAPHTVSATSATASLPSGVSWKDVRADIRVLKLYGSTYEDALALARQDVALHTQFLWKDLRPMLESGIKWTRRRGSATSPNITWIW